MLIPSSLQCDSVQMAVAVSARERQRVPGHTTRGGVPILFHAYWERHIVRSWHSWLQVERPESLRFISRDDHGPASLPPLPEPPEEPRAVRNVSFVKEHKWGVTRPAAPLMKLRSPAFVTQSIRRSATGDRSADST